MDFTHAWAWPQWTAVTLMFLGFLMVAAQHGKPRVQTSGEDKGKPFTYNAFVALARLALWVSILICGGFFR